MLSQLTINYTSTSLPRYYSLNLPKPLSQTVALPGEFLVYHTSSLNHATNIQMQHQRESAKIEQPRASQMNSNYSLY